MDQAILADPPGPLDRHRRTPRDRRRLTRQPLLHPDAAALMGGRDSFISDRFARSGVQDRIRTYHRTRRSNRAGRGNRRGDRPGRIGGCAGGMARVRLPEESGRLAHGHCQVPCDRSRAPQGDIRSQAGRSWSDTGRGATDRAVGG